MSTLVRTTGVNSIASTQNDNGSRLAFTLSNGNALVVTRDTNADTTHGGYGDNTGVEKLYVYESSDRVTWTLRATITTPTTTNRITATLYLNNDLSIFHEAQASGVGSVIRHNKMTYSGYTMAGWETVSTPATNEVYDHFDAHATDDSWLVLTFGWYNTSTNSNGYRTYLKPTAGGAWSNPANVTLDTSAYNKFCASVSVTSSITNTIGAGTYRQLHYAIGYAVGGSDQGVHVFNHWINTSTFAPNAIPVDSGVVTGQNTDQSALTGSGITQARECKFFKFTSKIWLGVINAADYGQCYALRFTTSTSGLIQEGSTAVSTLLTSANQQVTCYNLGIAYTNGTFLFMGTWFRNGYTDGSGNSYSGTGVLVTRTAATSGNGFDFATGQYNWWSENDGLNPIAVWPVVVASGGDKNNDKTTLDTLIQVTDFSVLPSTVPYRWRHEYNNLVKTINDPSKSPASGSTQATSNPNFLGTYQTSQTSVSVNGSVPGSQTRGTLEVQAAKDASFTTSLKDFTGIGWQTLTGTGQGTGFSQPRLTVPTPALLYLVAGSTVWYYRMRVVDEFGDVSAWTTTVTFTVTHPSTATQQTPAASKFIEYGSGSVYLQWKFADPWTSDWQTAYQVQIIRTDTSAVVYDSGKTTSVNQYATTTTLSTALKTIPLAWRVQVWDSGDQTGGYTGYSSFTILDGPVITVTAPTSGGTVVTPSPTVTFSATTYTAVPIVSLAVSVYQNGIQIWSTGVIPPPGSAASGTVYGIQVAGNLLHNGQNYSAQVSITDSWGITTTTALIPFAAAWTAPAAPTGTSSDATKFDNDSFAYNTVGWTSTTRDAAFLYYRVDRRSNVKNPDTGTIEDFGAWGEVYRTYDATSTNYTFNDYLAPAGSSVDYQVVQVVSKFSDEVPSLPSATITTTPVSPSYWLIDPTVGNVFVTRLYTVVGDSFTEQYEEAEYNIIGRGFHLDQGQRLGYTGSLSAQLRSSGGTSARHKRLLLQTAKSDGTRQLYLRNPFGDVFRVAVKSMQIDRIPGTGVSEFVDVTIPYDEVGV